MKNKMFIFHASAVDSSSVTSADNGADLDLAAFNPANITAMAAENNGSGLIYIYFKDSNKYEPGTTFGTTSAGTAGEMLEQAFVRLYDSNVSKLPFNFKNGKVQKGSNYKKPHLHDL